ncbi:MAG: hypothetical protein COB07_02080 [Sulfurovum sp.]|nr:MAG: hypothetical protein COB07_02080 [Sulfurovum sp.]
MENRNKQTLEQKVDQVEVSKKTSVSRRQFLKRSAYATPSLIILGSLAKPVAAFGSDNKIFPTNNKSSTWR